MIPERELALSALGIFHGKVVAEHLAVGAGGIQQQIDLLPVEIPAADQKAVAMELPDLVFRQWFRTHRDLDSFMFGPAGILPKSRRKVSRYFRGMDWRRPACV